MLATVAGDHRPAWAASSARPTLEFAEQFNKADLLGITSQSPKHGRVALYQTVSGEHPVLRKRCLTCDGVVGYPTYSEVSHPPPRTAASVYVQFVQRVWILIGLTE